MKGIDLGPVLSCSGLVVSMQPKNYPTKICTGKYLPGGETVELFRSSLSEIQEEKMLNKFKSYL